MKTTNTDKGKPLTVPCPSCRLEVKWNETFPYRPFCSKRCKDGDFIGWANEQNCIAGDAQFDDLLSQELEREFTISPEKNH